MSRTSRRRAVAVAAAGVFAVASTVSACAAGRNPQTAMPTQLNEGVNVHTDGVDVRNLFVLGPDVGQRVPRGGAVPVYAWFVNAQGTPDRLLAIEAPGLAQSSQIPNGAFNLPPDQLVSTGAPVAGMSASNVLLRPLLKDVLGGETVRLVLHFQRAGALTVNAPIVPRQDTYTTFAPAPTPTPTLPPTGSPTASPTGTATATPLPAARRTPRPAKTAKRGHRTTASPSPTS